MEITVESAGKHAAASEADGIYIITKFRGQQFLN
jgi:hypothetical protein